MVLKIKRREFLKSSAIATAGVITSTYPAFSEIKGRTKLIRPNILMITCHDIGQYIGCYGVQSLQTNNLDRLASKGLRFANCYSTSAVCSPGRGSLLTGRYPQSNGLMGLTHAPWWWKLNDSERHIAELLKNSGYTTYLIGLNHVDNDPKRLGYEEVLSEKHIADETVLERKKLINTSANQEQPFFAKVGFQEVHRNLPTAWI
jgi:N-sulfoglucosamine sulfohydrolase